MKLKKFLLLIVVAVMAIAEHGFAMQRRPNQPGRPGGRSPSRSPSPTGNGRIRSNSPVRRVPAGRRNPHLSWVPATPQGAFIRPASTGSRLADVLFNVAGIPLVEVVQVVDPAVTFAAFVSAVLAPSAVSVPLATLPAVHQALFGIRGSIELALLQISPSQINDQDHRGRTVIHRAVLMNNQGYIALLARCGADVNIPDNQRVMPLHMAVAKRNPDMIIALKAQGALLTLLDERGVTPRDWALQLGYTELLPLLR